MPNLQWRKNGMTLHSDGSESLLARRDLMSILKNTTVCRSGSTASHWKYETDRSTFNFNEFTTQLEFEFAISAAGGGTTDVLLKVGKDDLSIILKEVAKLAPETVDLFMECAEISRQKNIEKIEAERVTAEKRQNLADSLISEIRTELKQVKEYIYEKYQSAPSGQDEIEFELNEKINAINYKIFSYEKK